ncbi:MAG: DNA mismatch repair endonuclease MutL [Eubacteriales bacterium]|nr:DNA mismatch repair endonuclease MutL [Eubacteriales bacterium]
MIKLLDKATIDKIAAGEVIERPSSVIKELLENSIDARATAVTVEIKEGGLAMMRVTDNGCGIPSDEVRTAYMRHATSKIESAEDLAKIGSLGFRGEALSTIAAVSQTEMITKTPEALIGVKYEIHGGKEIAFSEVGVPNGTTIVVRNLFYNTPARKKFLKSAMTEGSYIHDLVSKIALSHPEIAFKLIVNGQAKLDTSGNGNIKDVIYQLFGRDITANLLPISYESDEISIDGYIGKPFISRGNRGFENYFVNHRYIKSSIVNRAIEEGYRTFVMQHKFPFTVLNITLATGDTDVNVHPTKMEFKYNNERLLFEVVSKAVRQSLLEQDLIIKDTSTSQNTIKNKQPNLSNHPEHNEKPVTIKPAEPYETGRKQQLTHSKNIMQEKYSSSYRILEQLKQRELEEKIIEQPNVALKILEEETKGYSIENVSENKQEAKTLRNVTGNPAIDAYIKNEQATIALKEEKKQAELSNEQISMFNDDFLSAAARKKHRLIGQVFDTYWLIEYERNLYIMDQHAAHEKIKYEELIQNLSNKEIYSQQLMPPMVITVSYAERQAILDHYDLFMKLGYDIEEFGGNEFKISAVPTNLFGLHGREMFLEFVGALIHNSGYMTNEMFVQRLATMACKAAIKGNMRLSFQEADALIDQLLKLENPYTCPHGRPTIISISDIELEKKFKRIV